MYKKTTTIIEEHGVNPMISKDIKLGNIYNNIPNEYSALGSATRLNSRHYYTLYLTHMREYLNLAYNKWPTANVKNSIIQLASTDFVTIMSPWFDNVGTNNAAQLAALKVSSVNMATSTCDVIDTIVSGGDRTTSIANAQKAITDYMTALSSLIFVFNNVAKNSSIMENYLNEVINQADSKMIKDWSTDNTSFFNGMYVLASNTIPGTVPWSDIFSEGLIEWQPWRFN